MIRQKRGVILNISSVASAVGVPNAVPYCSSKGGVNQLTKALAIEWAKYNIRVNALAPGYVKTPMTNNLLEDRRFKEKIRELVPLQRIGKTKDLHGIALVLCTNAGAYITGQTIYVDGGRSCW
jgi:NAD(P)-dependent dehydrogenase (short-subunit alcohol dehydrogenase family)